MKRIDIIRQALADKAPGVAVTAAQLADELGFARANVSSDLNRLCEMGEVEKDGTKPVFYHFSDSAPSTTADTEEEEFLRKNPSLSTCMAQAKAAIFYPPRGMPILLLGETGVGKSMLAEKIYGIAKNMKIMSPDAPFIIFNCSDYANNPQLLMGYLFGSKKGAYTGAADDRKGLLEKANNGILFLDEVHRLPPEGQEMLFSFIDRGTFRRLGDTEERRATAQLMCATTENPDSALLNTFVRRVPMLIHVPNLAQRTETERFTLMNDLFMAESAKIQQAVIVTPNTVRCLLTYHCAYNVGQFKSDIQILCARAYSVYVTGAVKYVYITSADLPEHIRSALYLQANTWSLRANLRLVGHRQLFCFDYRDTPESPVINSDLTNASVYDLIASKTKELRYNGLSDEEIGETLDMEIDQYFMRFVDSAKHLSIQQLSCLVSTDILFVCDHVMRMAGETLYRNFSDTIRNGLAMHVFNAVNRVKMGHSIANPQLNSIRKKFPQEFNVALEALQTINTELFLSLPLDEAAYLVPFFRTGASSGEQRHCLHILVMMHGSRTATAMVETVSQLLNHPLHAVAPVDVPMDAPLAEAYEKVQHYLRQLLSGDNVLFLYDMGSISNIVDKAKREFPLLNIKLCPLASTLHIVEAVQDAELGCSFEYTYNQVLSISKLYGKPLAENVLPSAESAPLIVAVFARTHAEADALTDNVEKELAPHGRFISVMNVCYADESDFAARIAALQAMGRVVAAVAETPPSAVLSVPVYRWADAVSRSALREAVNLEIAVDNTTRSLANVTKLLNVNDVVPLVRETVANCAQRLGVQLDTNLIICSLCHLVCTLERIASGERLGEVFKEPEVYIKRHPKEIRIIREECGKLGDRLGLIFTTEDICAYSLFFLHDA